MIKKIFILLMLTVSVNFAVAFNVSRNDVIEPSFENKIVYSLNNDSDYSTEVVQPSELNDDVFLTLQYSTEFTCDHENINSDFELQQHRNELCNYYEHYNNEIKTLVCKRVVFS